MVDFFLDLALPFFFLALMLLTSEFFTPSLFFFADFFGADFFADFFFADFFGADFFFADFFGADFLPADFLAVFFAADLRAVFLAAFLAPFLAAFFGAALRPRLEADFFTLRLPEVPLRFAAFFPADLFLGDDLVAIAIVLNDNLTGLSAACNYQHYSGQGNHCTGIYGPANRVFFFFIDFDRANINYFFFSCEVDSRKNKHENTNDN
jgi:uncharacterized protein YjbI with pentapeptide repeats